MSLGNLCANEISRSQWTAWWLVIVANAIWAFTLGWFLHHDVFHGTYLIILLIVGVYLYAAVYNGTNRSPIDWWMNNVLERGSGSPLLSNIVVGVMTALIIACAFYHAQWQFWTALGLFTVVGIPFCMNVMCRYD